MATRLGSIRYINSMPVDYGIVTRAVPFSGELIRAVPASLNSLMHEGSLDVSPVSSLFFAENASDLVLLPNFSISSRNGVRSVLLFSKSPIDRLHGAKIAVTSEGKSTPALLRILLAKRYQVSADLIDTPLLPSEIETSGYDAALVIGDDALAGAEKLAGKFRVYDLAEEWTAWTSLPFVFAVWAVRRDFAERDRGALESVRTALEDSRRWGARNMKMLVREAARQTGLLEPIVERYFGELCYGLDADLKRGLDRYVELAREMNLIPAEITQPEIASNARLIC